MQLALLTSQRARVPDGNAWSSPWTLSLTFRSAGPPSTRYAALALAITRWRLSCVTVVAPCTGLGTAICWNWNGWRRRLTPALPASSRPYEPNRNPCSRGTATTDSTITLGSGGASTAGAFGGGSGFGGSDLGGSGLGAGSTGSAGWSPPPPSAGCATATRAASTSIETTSRRIARGHEHEPCPGRKLCCSRIRGVFEASSRHLRGIWQRSLVAIGNA